MTTFLSSLLLLTVVLSFAGTTASAQSTGLGEQRLSTEQGRQSGEQLPSTEQDTQTQEQRLQGHVYYLASDSLKGRKAGTEDAAKAAKYIATQYEQMGMKPYFDDWYVPFTREGHEYTNVIGVIEGSDPLLKDEYIVIGAHYDHLGVKNGQVYNGADDNASGSAAIIEIARSLMASRESLKRSVIVAAFDAEELGLYGSINLAIRLDLDKVRLMMSIDMVGYYRQSGYLEFQGTSTIKHGKEIIQSVASRHGVNARLKGFENSVFTATDTEGFAVMEVPTLAITTGLKSPYHKPEDDAELIDYEGLDQISGCLTDLVLTLSSDPEFASSGRVAPKHGHGSTVMLGTTVGLGSAEVRFPGAAFSGKSRFGYSAGLTTQLCFGANKCWGIKADALFTHNSEWYPDESDMYNSRIKIAQNSITVPVQALYQMDGTGGLSLSLGGYYRYNFGGKAPVASSIMEPNDYGLAAGLGLRSGRIGFGLTYLHSLTNLYTEPQAPKTRLRTLQFNINWYFW